MAHLERVEKANPIDHKLESNRSLFFFFRFGIFNMIKSDLVLIDKNSRNINETLFDFLAVTRNSTNLLVIFFIFINFRSFQSFFFFTFFFIFSAFWMLKLWLIASRWISCCRVFLSLANENAKKIVTRDEISDRITFFAIIGGNRSGQSLADQQTSELCDNRETRRNISTRFCRFNKIIIDFKWTSFRCRRRTFLVFFFAALVKSF